MSRRKKRRYAHRLQVRFWQRGHPKPLSAYTTNISASGMFIGTASPLPPGSRVRVEILDPERGFILEGVVVHAARVSPLLKKLRESGMGVRFLSVPELVGELLPQADLSLEDTDAAGRPAVGGSKPSGGRPEAAAGREPEADAGTAEPEPAESEVPEPEAPEPEPAEPEAAKPEAPGPEAPKPELAEPGAPRLEAPRPEAPKPEPAEPEAARPEPVEPESAATRAPSRPGAPPAPPPPLETTPERSYTLRYPSLPQFLSVLERDIENDGIFVTTQDPAELEELISLHIHVPPPVDATVRTTARVVQLVEPGPGEANLLVGFGAQFVDPDAVKAELRRLIYGD